MRQSCFAAILILSALTLGPLSATPAPLSIEVKIDLVDAMKELAHWVTAGFSRWDERQKQVVKDAVPIVVADLTDIAAIKQEIYKWWVGKAPEFHQGILHLDDSVRQLHTLLKVAVMKLNKDVESIDPNWKAKNITTQWGLAQVRLSRNLTVSTMTAIIGKNGKGDDDSEDELKTEDIPGFFERQKNEADELLVLAKEMSTVTNNQ
jgi:hypothetical protein